MSFHGFDRSGGVGGGQLQPLQPRQTPRPMSEINVTPLVDVMLVLLVIFILTAPLLTSAIRLDLPQTPAARPSESAHKLSLVVDKAGDVYLDGVLQTTEGLLGRLRAVAQVHPDSEVQLRADAQVPYGRMVEVIGLAQQAGLSRVGFVADASAPGAGAGAGASTP